MHAATGDVICSSCNILQNRQRWNLSELQLASKQTKDRIFLGCSSRPNIDKRWSFSGLQLTFRQTKPHPTKLLLYFFAYGVHPYRTQNTDNKKMHKAPHTRMSVRPSVCPTINGICPHDISLLPEEFF